VQKHFKVERDANDSFDSDQDDTVREKVFLNVGRVNLDEFAKTNLEHWELKTLDLLKFDYSKYSF
jgi:hypothetical protein